MRHWLGETEIEWREDVLMTPGSFERKGGLFLYKLGSTLAKPTYRVGPRQTDYYSMHFVMEGEVRLMYGEEQVTLGKGDLFCKFPHLVYRYQVVPGAAPLRMKWISFAGGQAPYLVQQAGITQQQPYCREVLNPEIEMTLQQLLHVSRVKQHKQQLIMIGLVYRLFSQLLPDKAAEDKADGSTESIRRSIRFMDIHYADKITVRDIAAQAGVHHKYFSRLFAASEGISPAKYLHRMRMNKSCDLLRLTTLPITEIAMMVGYPDLYAFTRVFSKQYGMPPSRFRAEPSLQNDHK